MRNGPPGESGREVDVKKCGEGRTFYTAAKEVWKTDENGVKRDEWNVTMARDETDKVVKNGSGKVRKATFVPRLGWMNDEEDAQRRNESNCSCVG